MTTRVSLCVAALALLLAVANAQPRVRIGGNNPSLETRGPLAMSSKVCANQQVAINEDTSINSFMVYNTNCTSGTCDNGISQFKSRCSSLSGRVCSSYVKYTAINGEIHQYNRYECLGTDCYMDADMEAFEKETALYMAGNTKVSVNMFCGFDFREEEPDLVRPAIQLLIFIAALVFVYFEKQRRWKNGMAAMWPVNRGHGQLRTTLCECWTRPGCVRVCLCPWPMASFNQAALNDRQWTFCDFCCMNFNIIYFNRQTLRRRLDSPPEPCLDCLTAVCCAPCAVGQHTLEIERGGLGALGNNSSNEGSGFAMATLAPTANQSAPLVATGEPVYMPSNSKV